MRQFVLVGVLVGLVQLQAYGQDQTLSTASLSLQGTWASQIALPGGGFVPFAIDTFSAGGAHIGVNQDPSHSAHIGVWVCVGDRRFMFSTTFFTHDDKGVFNGIVKARGLVTMSEDHKSYDGTVERVVMDTSGNVLQVLPGIKAHSVRVDLELQSNPLP
jgi:hypothetical protein